MKPKNLKNLLSLFMLMLVLVLPIHAQQPAAQQGQPLYPVNAKYVNGVAPGYWPTKGSGLTLNISSGTSYCGTSIVTYAGGTLALTDNATNYVYLNVAASCVPASNTTGFSASTVPIAIATTAGGAITNVQDDRTPFTSGSTVQGDGTVENTILSGSPPTMSLVPANAGTALMGPIASLGSNVSFRQGFTCISGGTTAACPVTNLQAGDLLVALPMYTVGGGWYFGSTSSSNASWTQYGGSSSAHRAIGVVSTTGNDTITFAGGGTASGLPILILDLSGAASYVDANSAYSSFNNGFATIPASITNTVGATSATDAVINVAESNGTCYGGWALNPVSSSIYSWAPSNNASTGEAWIYAPGNTSSVNYKATTTTHAGSCHNDIGLFTLVFTQNASASEAPPTYRKLTEADLPASAISAIQSVNRFAVTSPVSLPSNTNTTILSETVAMPNDGCPCRVQIITSGIVNSTASGTWTSWVSDGTTDYATVQSITSDSHAPPLTATDFSSAYSNNQSVTFTWKVNPGTYTGTPTMQINSSAAASTSSLGSYMDLVVLQSRN